jgi:signal transduction histidine kinase
MAGRLRQTVATGLREGTLLRLRQHTPAIPLAPDPPPAVATLAAATLDAGALDAGALDAGVLAADPAGPAEPGRSRPRAPLSAGLWHSLPAGLAFTRGASRRATARAARAGDNFSWPWRVAWVDVAWVLFSVVNLLCILVFQRWETVPFHFIWISLTLLYGFRVWATRPTLWVLTLVMVTTFAAIGWDVYRGSQSVDELNEVPLMAIMFWLMVWHAQRRLDADHERDLVSDENARLLGTQRQFLQDASHQLRTPITIALGHAELLARELTDQTEQRDIQVVVGELTRLRRLSERLLIIAASEDPDFLRPEPIDLDGFMMDVIARWQPTADRQWQVGRLDAVTVVADRERLGLAVDALLENAVRHTASGDMIGLSVLVNGPGLPVRMIVADTGEGIAPSELEHIFDRFRTGSPPGGTAAAGITATGSKGTGLGLALVRAVANAHGGDVRVRSTPGAGSEFELVLPAPAVSAGTLYPALPLSWASSPPEPAPDRTLKEDPWPSRNR